ARRSATWRSDARSSGSSGTGQAIPRADTGVMPSSGVTGRCRRYRLCCPAAGRSEVRPMRSAWIRVAAIALTCGAIALGFDNQLLACTGFCAVGADGRVLVGNNEDYDIPRTKLWFVPATPGAYGRMYVGFDDLWPQGGMNERGLFFDGFAALPVRAAGSADLPQYSGNITDAAMGHCCTADEVVGLVMGEIVPREESGPPLQRLQPVVSERRDPDVRRRERRRGFDRGGCDRPQDQPLFRPDQIPTIASAP